MVTRFSAASLAALLAAACSTAPAEPEVRVVTVVKEARPIVPSECTSPNPPRPVLSGGTAGAVAEERQEFKRNVLRLEKLRSACAASLSKQIGSNPGK